MNTHQLFRGLIIFALLPILSTSNLTPTRAAPESARDPIEPRAPAITVDVGVELSPGYSQNANPGSILTYTHVVTNTGTNTDTFALRAASSQGWPVSLLGATGILSLPLQLNAGLTATLRVSLTVPTTAISGTVNTTVITATSQTSPTLSAVAMDITTVKIVTRHVYMPLVLRRWPPIPDVPVLNPIINPDGDGNYTVSWNAAYLANTYTLQEDDNAAFSSPTTQFTGSGTSWPASGKLAGTYYYRVRATNIWGNSGWSNIQSVTVLPPPDVPVLNPISNPDGDENYTVSWNAAYLANSYTLQEDDDVAFSSPTTQYTGPGISWPASGKLIGTYYYRVKATNVLGDSGWSNVQLVSVSVQIILSENFEGSFPGPWDVFDTDGVSHGEYYWAKRNCRAYSSSYSGWAIGGGANGASLGCGSSYSNDTDSWMVYGPFSLVGASAGNLSFKLWLNSEADYDGICRFASIDGVNFSGTCTTGNSSGWIDRVLDLTNVYGLGNLMGRPNVWVALEFYSDYTITDSEGAYVDNIVLRKCAPTCPALNVSAPISATRHIADVPMTRTLRK